MANSEDVLERADKVLAPTEDGEIRRQSLAGMLSLIFDLAAQVRELRQKLAEPWRHFSCPETQQPCGRMCLSMCHRRSDLIGELRRDRARLDWVLNGGPIDVSVDCGKDLAVIETRAEIDREMDGREEAP